MPPTRIPDTLVRTERLVLRCWDAADAPLLKDAIDTSLEHLRAWMPWAWREPSELAVIVDRLARFRDRFLRGEEFAYGIFDAAQRSVLGGIGLHPRVGPDALEIGYWIRASAAGRGCGTEAARAATRIGFEQLGVARLEIRCDPANHASAAIPRRLGYRHRETLHRDSRNADGTARDTMVWELTAAEYRAQGTGAGAPEG